MFNIKIKYHLSVVRDNLFYWIWLGKRKSIPSHSIFKRKRILRYAKKFSCSTFVEGGTFHGKTILFVRKCFEKMYSSEIYGPLYEDALRRTKFVNNVTLFHGRSEDLLAKIKDDVSGRVLFWLDAHYSGDGTGKSETECPILEELDTIKTYQRNDHVILIDDAREFKGMNDYPPLHVALKKLFEINEQYTIEIKDDCIIATP